MNMKQEYVDTPYPKRVANVCSERNAFFSNLQFRFGSVICGAQTGFGQRGAELGTMRKTFPIADVFSK
jgi:hypothetical protein